MRVAFREGGGIAASKFKFGKLNEIIDCSFNMRRVQPCA